MLHYHNRFTRTSISHSRLSQELPHQAFSSSSVLDMFFEIALRNYLQLRGDFKEGVEKLFGEDRHFVDEGIRAIFLVEDEDGR